MGGRVAITDSASYGADRAADAGDLLMVICFVSAGLQWYFSILVKIYCLSTIVRVLNLVSKFLFLCVRKSCEPYLRFLISLTGRDGSRKCPKA